jgi:hypothetical protein
MRDRGGARSVAPMTDTTLQEGPEGRAVPDAIERPIVDRASFDALTTGGHGVAGLYAFAKLDPLIELACGVARDFYAHPHLFTDVDDVETPGRLARLDARVGHAEDYPSREQRLAMYEPVFGPCAEESGDSDFGRLRDALLTAAATYAEWSQKTGLPMLLERIRTAHRPFREYLTGVSGASVNWSRSVLAALANDQAYAVLRDRDAVAVYGVGQEPVPQWPYRLDSNGDKVVEQISKVVESESQRRLTRESFSALQRVALRGAEALAAILDFDESRGDGLVALVTRCYTWHAALHPHGPHTSSNGSLPLPAGVPAVTSYSG